MQFNATGSAIEKRKKCYTASGSHESTCVSFLTHFHPADIPAAAQSSQGSAGETGSSAHVSRAATMLYNIEMDTHVTHTHALAQRLYSMI